MHADLGLEPAVGVIALDAERGGFDAGDFATGHFHQLGLPAARLRPAQVHAQEDFRPVLGFGTTGAGLDIDERGGGIELAREHALEFQLADAGIDLGHVIGHGLHGVLVAVGGGHLEQFLRIFQRGRHLFDAGDDGIELGAFAAKLLRALRIIPDGGALELAVDFL